MIHLTLTPFDKQNIKDLETDIRKAHDLLKDKNPELAINLLFRLGYVIGLIVRLDQEKAQLQVQK